MRVAAERNTFCGSIQFSLISGVLLYVVDNKNNEKHLSDSKFEKKGIGQNITSFNFAKKR